MKTQHTKTYTAEAMLREKFIPINICIKKQEISLINYLNFHIRKLEKRTN